MRFEQQVQHFLDGHVEKENTRRAYEQALRYFARWYRTTYGEEPGAEGLTRHEVREYVSYLINVERKAPSTVNQRLSALKKLAQFYGRDINVKGVRQVPPPIRTLTRREITKLLSAADQEEGWLARRNVAILSLMLYAGLRVGEVVKLQVGNVTILQRKGKVFVPYSKGGVSRFVPLSKEARRALTVWFQVHPLLKGEKQNGDENVILFPSKSLKPLSPRNVYDVVEKYARRAGLDGVSPHTLRHTFATMMVETGADVRTVQGLLGHKNLETTMRYLHPNEERMQDLVDRL